MSNEIRFTPAALNDLDGIHEYIERESHSQQIADRLLHRIQATARNFATQPLAGAPCPELFRNGRYFVVGIYVVYYRPADDGIELFRVIHGAQDIEDVFRRMEEW